MNDEACIKYIQEKRWSEYARAVTQLPDSCKKGLADFRHKSAICVSNFHGKHSTTYDSAGWRVPPWWADDGGCSVITPAGSCPLLPTAIDIFQIKITSHYLSSSCSAPSIRHSATGQWINKPAIVWRSGDNHHNNWYFVLRLVIIYRKTNSITSLN